MSTIHGVLLIECVGNWECGLMGMRVVRNASYCECGLLDVLRIRDLEVFWKKYIDQSSLKKTNLCMGVKLIG